MEEVAKHFLELFVDYDIVKHAFGVVVEFFDDFDTLFPVSLPGPDLKSVEDCGGGHDLDEVVFGFGPCFAFFEFFITEIFHIGLFWPI